MSANPAEIVPLQLPSHSIEAEQSVLGGLLLDNQAWERVTGILAESNFYRDDHRRIFRHIGKLVSNGQPADLVTVFESIKQSEDKDKTGGPAYLGLLAQNTPSAYNIARYAEIVREHAQRREIAKIGLALVDGAAAPGSDAHALRREAESQLAAIGSGVDAPSRFPRVWLDDVQAAIDADYLIKGLIERGRLTVIFGPSGDGKTFFTLDMVGHIATGIRYRGRRVHIALGVYIAAEAGASILRRFFAWREHNLGEAREGRLPLAIVTRATNLLSVVEVDELIDELRAIADEAGMPLGFVVFDTLSRSIAGGDENSAEDMTRAIAAADAIRDELGAAVVLVHHSGKDATKGARGHSSLFAAADSVISVIERVATVDKARDGAQGEAFPFTLDVVNLGTDRDGDGCTTCIVRHLDGEASAATAKRKKITPSAQVALDALKAALDANGETIPATSILPRVRAVTVDKWQEVYARIRPIQQDLPPDEAKRERNARRMAFRRAQDELQAVRVAGTEAGFWWLIGART